MKDATANIAGVVLAAVVKHTSLDDQIIDKVVQEVRETIPGDSIEPIIGDILIRVGERLRGDSPRPT